MLRIVYLLICFTLLFSFTPHIEPAHAIPKAVKAKSEFMLADKLFNQGNYAGAIEHAEKAKTLLGKSNSRIEYVLTKAYNDQGMYDKALAALEVFFNVTPESMSGSDEYNEMVSLYAEVELRAINMREHSDRLKKIAAGDLSVVLKNMVSIPSGCFQMGDSFGGDNDDEKPPHEVCFINGFFIGKYEVSQALWRAVMGSNPSKYNNGPTCPVEMVSWNDVQQFLKKLNSRTGKQYRLPTEAEWEYAARSGGKREKYAGFSSDSVISQYANFCDNNCEKDYADTQQNDSYKETAPIGSFQPNGLGIHDMTGNVWEWCSDWYGENYYHQSPKNNPTGPSSGKERVSRGGSFLEPAEYLRATNKFERSFDKQYSTIGFRLVHP